MATPLTESSPDVTLNQLDPLVLDNIRRSLNKSFARRILKTVEEDPSLEFESVLSDALIIYKRRIAEGIESVRRRSTTVLGRPPRPRVSRVYGHEIASAQPMIVFLLHSIFIKALSHRESHSSSLDIPSLLKRRLPQLIEKGKCLFSGPSRMVVQLNNVTVVKFGPTISKEEPTILEYLARHSNLPVPRSQGFVVIGDTSYIFMSYIPGETLESRWEAFDKRQKSSIRSQLNILLSTMRHIPYPGPASAPLGSLSSPHVCKDARRSLFVSSPDIRTISQFHDFLVSHPGRGVSSGYIRWLRSLLRDEYHIKLTHGDFHPRNILVVDEPDGSVRVSGIIDWEMGGWYPEYWEMYKAFNTRGADDESDWWDCLPEAISGYDREVAECKVIEQATMA